MQQGLSIMGKYRKILVAIDGSESSRNAMYQAFKLANEEKCWITIASVVPAYDGEIETIGIKDIRAALRKPCVDALEEAEKIAKAERMLVKLVCEEGEVHERIVDLADAENCDLIVMGRRGLRRLERAFVGSVTARVIGHTQRDILVVPKDTVVGWQKILLATEGSKYSIAATLKAISFAKSYGGELKVLSAVDIPPEYYAEAPYAVDDLVKKAKAITAGVKKQAEDAGVKVDTYVGEADAFDAIIKLATEEKVGMVIIGSHGRTGLRRLLMGGVAEKVIGHAPCPVLVVKS
jgi:nucleotide-binding universal stress UspA family protein